jgi:signal transduction histidine kinase
MASPFDAALRDVLDGLSAATRELEVADDPSEVAEKSLELALRLTSSTYAVIGLGDQRHGYDRLFASTTDHSRPLSDRAMSELVAAAGFGPEDIPGRSVVAGDAIGAELRAHGQTIGVFAVGRSTDYSDRERTALEVFAANVSLAMVVASRWDERAQSVERIERAHEQAVEVLQAISSHAARGGMLADFYRRLARTVGEHVGAGRVLFWKLGPDGMLTPVPGGHHVDEEMLARLKPTKAEPGRDDLASRVVFDDFVFRASRIDDPPEHADVLEILGVASATSVPWRTGERRLGLLAAYDSIRPEGFTREDTWVLQQAGLAAGLVTRLWESEEELRRSVDRLTKVDGARQMLLKNMTTVVEKERKRFVSELHDDALQKLTAAELHLARLEQGTSVDPAMLEKVGELLESTERALRRLVFEVRPPALEGPDGLAESIRERTGMVTVAGIEPEIELDLPAEMSVELRTIVFREVAEAISNAERHSKATKVKVSLRTDDGGILGVVHDNGEGFVVTERSNLPGHLGLLALRERALMAGGRYQIESRPGGGTRVEFWIPLDQ